MGLLDYIGDILRERQVAKTNIQRRGITFYKPSQIGGFVESDITGMKVVCSGDSEDLRSEVIVSLCVSAANAGLPAIVLHQGDAALKSQFGKVFGGSGIYTELGPGAGYFDPLYGMQPSRISRLMVDTAPEKYGLTCDGQAYIDVLTGFLAAKGRMITLKGLCSCPHARLPALISSGAGAVPLPPSIMRDLQTSLAQGQKEAHKVRAYLSELCDECIPLLPPDKSAYVGCESIFSAAGQKKVLSLDIISDGNSLLLKILAEQLQTLIRRRMPFFLILDNIGIREENGMKGLCLQQAGDFGCALAGDDVYALCGGDEKLFGTILGSSGKWFVFHHSSGLSAEKWSGAFSSYRKIDTTVNIGKNHTGGWGFGLQPGSPSHGFLNWNSQNGTHQGYAYANKDEAVIRGEEIRGLDRRSGYIYTAAERETAYVETFLPQ